PHAWLDRQTPAPRRRVRSLATERSAAAQEGLRYPRRRLAKPELAVTGGGRARAGHATRGPPVSTGDGREVAARAHPRLGGSSQTALDAARVRAVAAPPSGQGRG